MYSTYDVTWGVWFIVDIYRTDRPIGDGVLCCVSPTDQLACICGVCNPSIVMLNICVGKTPWFSGKMKKYFLARNHIDFVVFGYGMYVSVIDEI